MRSRGLPLVILIIALTLLPNGARAHDVRPSVLRISEVTPDTFSVVWKQPKGQSGAQNARPRLPKTCASLSGSTDGGKVADRWMVRCETKAFEAGTIRIEGLDLTLSETYVVFDRLDGPPVTAVIRPDQPFLKLGDNAPKFPPISSFSALGFQHILSGLDHLLFLTGLMLLVRGLPAILKTITGFTIAHSLTLALASLDIIHLAGPPVEAVIALSIMFLARETIAVRAGKETLTWKFPWSVAFFFGLIHGFGFATALTNVGLPTGQALPALFMFNLGIEAGQVSFVLMALFICWGLSRIHSIRTRFRPAMASYLVGSIGAIWFVERAATLF